MTNKRIVTRVKTSDGHYDSPVGMGIDALYEKLRSGYYAKRVNNIAAAVTAATLEDRPYKARLAGSDALPFLLFSAILGRGGIDDVRKLTHLVLLSFDCPEGIAAVERLKERVAQLPNTLLAFTGSSRKTLKVVVECRYADGYEPHTHDEYSLFVAEAHQTASRLYHALLGCEASASHGILLAGCRMSSDKTAFYNADAQVVTVFRRDAGQSGEIELSSQGDVMDSRMKEEEKRFNMEYHACLDKAREETGDSKELVQALAHYCRKARLPEELCLRETMLRWLSIPVSDELKRRIFRTVYKEPIGEGKPVSQMNEKERIARFIKDFFDRRYQLRYNEVKQVEEFRPNAGIDMPWKPLTQRDLKRIAFEEMMEGGYGWSVDIETYVQSSLVRSYNPITEFLFAAEKYYDGKRDYIGELARRVPTDYMQWEKYFHRWFLAMVAQWMGRNREFGNAVVPMLIGKQGTHKSTFCKLLLPRSLREYYMDDIKMGNAEQVERVLGRMALVNIDEYNAKTDREQAKIKRLLTERDVQVRRMRSDQYTLTPRLCSFIATTNDMQPLPGGDGTRRYLCVEVKGVIDTETPIDYRRLYAQALREIYDGMPFHFFPNEEAEIQEHNRPYQLQTSAEEAVLTFFAPARKAADNFMRAVDIQQELAKHLRAADVPNIKHLTVSLKRCGFSNGSLKGQRGWYVEKVKR